MNLPIATMVALAHQCGPSVAVETLVSLVHAESRFNPYAIGVNAKGVVAPNPSDRATAVTAARSLIAKGYSIDLGLGQINNANLKSLGLSIEDAFDPCRNLAAAARVLSTNYLLVVRSSASTEDAIATAMSLYNTWSRSRGFANGYVDRVYASSSIVVPTIKGQPAQTRQSVPSANAVTAPPVAAIAPTPAGLDAWNTSAGSQTAKLMVFGAAPGTPPKGRPE